MLPNSSKVNSSEFAPLIGVLRHRGIPSWLLRVSKHALFVLLLVLLSAGSWVRSAMAEVLPRFNQATWNDDISTHAVHPQSDLMIQTLDTEGGFGFGRMQIDFSLHVVHAPPDAPTRLIVQHPSGYYAPDCEPVGSSIPVPATATLEGQTVEGDLTCDNTSADCHLLVVQDQVLYETFASTSSGDEGLEALCLAVWYLDGDYSEQLRGEHCTSADAAGLPMAPLLFNADEIAASLALDATGGGDLGHAVRFILPNSRMASDEKLGGDDGVLYVRPATHAGAPYGPKDSVPYGSRLRLKDSFATDGYSPAAKVVLNTFKRYGMVLADGGNIALTAESDLYTTTKWSDLGFGPHVFWDTDGAGAVAITDFEVLDTGDRIPETYNCVRTTVGPGLFSDDFESGNTDQWSATFP